MQAQDYAAVKWAIGQRVRNVLERDVEAAIEDGRLLRTHVLRPTWHLVLPSDIRWMLKLTAPRIRALMAYYDRQLELDEATFRRSNATIAKALRGGKYLTRNELGHALSSARIVASGQRLGHLMMRAELDAVVCSGPRRGKQFTYALLDERAPPSKPLAREEALATLARRYVRSHGPCLIQDFSWWSGLSVADAKAGIEAIKSELEQLRLGQKTYWFFGSKKPPRLGDSLCHLLPNYDEYLVAHKDHTPLISGAPAQAPTREDSVLSARIVDRTGQICGGWRRTLEKSRVVIKLELFAAPSRALSTALRAEAERYAAFLGLGLRLTTTSSGRRVRA
jgi:hypothetical protein